MHDSRTTDAAPTTTPSAGGAQIARVFSAADELRHEGVAVEAWWFWGWTEDADLGWFIGVELRPPRFDYWAGLWRDGSPYLYVDDLDALGLRDGLELKPPELWADHMCEVPFTQWTLTNETYGVLLDDPDDATTHARGHRTPVAMDIEWYAAGEPQPIERGYAQSGHFDAVVEVPRGAVRADGNAYRVHTWGVPYVPNDLALPATERRLPYRRSDGGAVDQVLTRTGFHARRRTAARPRSVRRSEGA